MVSFRSRHSTPSDRLKSILLLDIASYLRCLHSMADVTHDAAYSRWRALTFAQPRSPHTYPEIGTYAQIGWNVLLDSGTETRGSGLGYSELADDLLKRRPARKLSIRYRIQQGISEHLLTQPAGQTIKQPGQREQRDEQNEYQ
jgi:hypothetical protein